MLVYNFTGIPVSVRLVYIYICTYGCAYMSSQVYRRTGVCIYADMGRVCILYVYVCLQKSADRVTAVSEGVHAYSGTGHTPPACPLHCHESWEIALHDCVWKNSVAGRQKRS